MSEYDVATDRSREDIMMLCPATALRLQLSVFECDRRTRRVAAALRSKVCIPIDPLEDQVRLYPLNDCSARRQW
jgi:CRISPR-associated endonuclease Cas2